MSNFLVCIMLLGIMRATNQEFVTARLEPALAVIAIAFFLDLFRLAYHLYWKDTK